jgi:hypothetical protein
VLHTTGEQLRRRTQTHMHVNTRFEEGAVLVLGGSLSLCVCMYVRGCVTCDYFLGGTL